MSITDIASSLDSMDLILPGDVILLPGSHIMIFNIKERNLIYENWSN